MTVTHDMTGDVAVITGGAQGIGLACARRLSASGAKVHLFDIDEAALTVACDEIGPNAAAHKVNISDPESVSAAVAKRTIPASVSEAFGVATGPVFCKKTVGEVL